MNNEQFEIEFNTGRGYTPEGQIIKAKAIEILEETCPITEEPLLRVAFMDTSRGIIGEVVVSDLSQRAVMNQYDHGRYTGISGYSALQGIQV